MSKVRRDPFGGEQREYPLCHPLARAVPIRHGADSSAYRIASGKNLHANSVANPRLRDDAQSVLRSRGGN